MKVPFWIWLAFLTVYFTVGDSADKYWSCLFFASNYILIIWLFLKQPKSIRRIGVSVCSSLLAFSIIRLFMSNDYKKLCIFILFAVAIIICLKFFKNEQNNGINI